MVVTVDDVRTLLNDISVEELSNDTIRANIDDAEAWVDDAGGDYEDGDWGERATKYRAAYLSYIVSNTFLSASAGPISVREAFELKAEHLSDLAQDFLGRSLDKPVTRVMKIPLLRKYSSDEQEDDPDRVSLTV